MDPLLESAGVDTGVNGLPTVRVTGSPQTRRGGVTQPKLSGQSADPRVLGLDLFHLLRPQLRQSLSRLASGGIEIRRPRLRHAGVEGTAFLVE